MKSNIDALMESKAMSALVIFGAAEHNPPMYYFTGGRHITHATVVKKRGEAAVLFHSDIERDEAAKSGLKLIPYSKYDDGALLEKAGKDILLSGALRCELMLRELGVDAGRVGVYGFYDVSATFGMLSHLQKLMPEIEFVGEARDESILTRAMETKEESEVERIRKMGQITVNVVGKVADFLTSCNVRDDEVLLKADNSPLTVGAVHAKIRLWTAEQSAELPSGFIFAIGRDAGVPHSTGNPADEIRLGKTIIFDFYPAEAGGGYYYDFTRTWSLGYAPPEAQKLYDEVKTIHAKTIAAFELNAPFKKYQQMTCEYFEALGHQTPLNTKSPVEGYVHSLGHGLGLNIHERPFCNFLTSDDQRLVAGVVFTVEPSLYYPEKEMGVRIEDAFWMRPDGKIEILAEYSYDFVLPMKKQT